MKVTIVSIEFDLPILGWLFRRVSLQKFQDILIVELLYAERDYLVY